MTTGIVVKPDPAAANAVDDAISQASGAFHRGARQVWLNQRFDVDALTPAAVIATAVPGLGVGTAVVPINPRHPLLVASAAPLRRQQVVASHFLPPVYQILADGAQ
jgi:alkanesulfonate monooxygenase SsuD/methylene tetrahydromethanopterin reductase-like flavin-dependent oxidoreductase (luciferase family)